MSDKTDILVGKENGEEGRNGVAKIVPVYFNNLEVSVYLHRIS